MTDNSNGMSCVIGCWIAALAAGILLAALLMVIGGFALTPAVFLGLLGFVLLGAFLSFAVCKGGSAQSNTALASHNAGGGSAAVVTSASAAAATGGAGMAATDAGVASTDSSVIAADAGSSAAMAETVPAAGIKAGTTLNGEDELAGRKGEWKYDGGEVAKPKAKAKPQTKAAAKPKAAAAADGSVDEGSKPELLSQARAGGPDDLKQIKGVGPKMEGMLHDMGVYHFDQVASWSEDEVRWVDANLKGFNGRVARDEWVSQAKILADGGTTEFSQKVGKGGVY